MEKQADHQLELFSQSQDNPKLSVNRFKRNSFVARIWGYEKTILIIIALLITGIISFSFGVEKSKRTPVNPVRNTTQTNLNTIASNGVNQPALANLKGKSPVGQKAMVWPPLAKAIAKPTIDLTIKGSKVIKDATAVEISLKKVEPPKQPPVVLTQQGLYTIQVASFKTNLYAQKEVELLKRRGYKAVALNKGGHIILCVGNFPDKKQAQSLLSELSRYYKDCLIRRF